MGNALSCCLSRRNTNATSHQPSHAPQSSSATSIESILNTIQEEQASARTDEIIKILDDLLSKIKGQGEGVSTSAGLQNLAYTTTAASQVVDFVSTEAEKIGNMDLIYQELGSAGTSVLNAIAGTHFIFLGLSLVAYTFDRYLKKRSNDSDCMELLEKLLELAKDVKKFEEAVPGEGEKVRKAMVEIVVGAVICCDYIDRGACRYILADVMVSQLQKTKDQIHDLRCSLTLTATTYIAGQIPRHSLPSPSELLDFQPEGIEDQVAEVKKLLDIGGSEKAIAVVIVGIGGKGKSTLAASVIKSLNLSSTNFKFSMVIVDQKTPDKTSHLLKLQRDIISDFKGEILSLRGTQLGRTELSKAMESKSCFLYIDNVVDSYYIQELLPRDLLTENSQNTKIRILITSRQNDLEPLLNIKNSVYPVPDLSYDTAKNILSRIILQGKEPVHDFDEKLKINELAEQCRSVPLLLSSFGNHLKGNRDEGSYEDAIKALNKGIIDRYTTGGRDELLSEILMHVYDKMNDTEAQEAFLDICLYFHDHPWDLVADIVDRDTLHFLYKRMLVKKSEVDTVIVHDILRSMGVQKAKGTRLMNYEEFNNMEDDELKIKNVKGMVLESDKFLHTLETRHLDAMRHSLRVLVLGDWIRVEGSPCYKAFENLRYLEVGDLKDFPFKDVSKMEKLNVFFNRSKPGMELAQLPPSLKHLSHRVPYLDCTEFARLSFKNLKSLKTFIVKTKRTVRLPQGFKLPASLEHLELNSCEQLLPETLGHLPALRTLVLDKCDLKCLPQEFTQSVRLRSLSMRHCTDMIYLGENIFGSSLCLLRDLDLTGCTQLEKLPADLGTLTALQKLNIERCENLSVLPENFGELKSLKTLDLNGCTTLQRLPDSFGMLLIDHLILRSLPSLKELPQSMGDLSCLKFLSLCDCQSLEFVPDSFVGLTHLEVLHVGGCSKLCALPKNFDQLRSLTRIRLWHCPSLTRLPDGFESLKTLKYMELSNRESLVVLPACFEMLLSLEELVFAGMLFSSLPDGLGKLNKLKILEISSCPKLQAVPQDLENQSTLERLELSSCPMLEGTTMDQIVKLQNCRQVVICRSTKLIERWNEMEEKRNLPMIVRTSWPEDEHEEELDRVRRVCLLSGECIELDSTREELKHHSSMPIPTNSSIALISVQSVQRQLLQPIVDMANERASRNCAGQLRIIYAPNQHDETEKIRQTMMMLPPGISYAIPSTDTRRLALIGRTVFYKYILGDFIDPELVCYMADVREDDEGHQILKDGKRLREHEISKTSGPKLPISENSDEEAELSDGVVEFINCVCESKTESPSGQCSRLPEENMVGEFIQKLKNNSIDHFSDNKVKVDHLQEKTIAIILIDRNSLECIRLQQIYRDIKLKQSNFEAIWIPLREEEDLGFGTYSRSIQWMPWLTLEYPKLIKTDDIKDKTPRVIILNSGGSTGNPNALSLLMAWGAEAYPFTKGSLSQLDLKSSLEVLFRSMEIKEVNNKVIFLYAEPPGQELKMKCSLEKLVQIHGKGNFEIVYVGCFFAERKIAEGDTQSLQKAYEDVTESMSWTKLSFSDMMAFWYRSKSLSDETVEKSKWASTLKRVVEAVLDEGIWLVVVDGDGMVTASGVDVVEMACESSDEVEMMMGEELRESLKEGKCSERVRAFFRDELNHPLHPHPLRTCKTGRFREFACDRCDLRCVHEAYGKRRLRCYDCDWDLCSDCWMEFVKEEVRRQPTQES